MNPCSRCGSTVRTKGGRCSPCAVAASKRWKEKSPENRERANRRNAQTAAEQREWFDSHKRVPCADCGEQYPPYVMDFDHVRGVKEFNLAPSWRLSRARLEAEIAKCDVVCSNCHRERTHARRYVLREV